MVVSVDHHLRLLLFRCHADVRFSALFGIVGHLDRADLSLEVLVSYKEGGKLGRDVNFFVRCLDQVA